MTETRRILVMGAGMVARPLVHDLLGRGYRVQVSDQDLEKADALTEGFDNGSVCALDINDADAVCEVLKEQFLVVVLLPPALICHVARLCLQEKKHLLSAYYVTPEMAKLEQAARDAGLIFLNEVGLDPGLDHMTVMELLHRIRERGLTIKSFHSHAGGFPARSAANNPLRYKFSWNPKGVLDAITRASTYRKNGHVIVVPGEEKLHHAALLRIPGVGVFESSPNADALYYSARYGLGDVDDVRRCTLRYPLWAAFWRFMIHHGFFSKARTMTFKNQSVLDALFALAGMPRPKDLQAFLFRRAHTLASFILEVWDDLGLCDDRSISGPYTSFDLILECAQKRWQYAQGERDLVVMMHQFQVASEDGDQTWTSLLVRKGSERSTAMAELVGLPLAIAARLIVEDRIRQRGVMIPLNQDIVEPTLQELNDMGISHTVSIT